VIGDVTSCRAAHRNGRLCMLHNQHSNCQIAGTKNANLSKATASLPEYLQKKAHLSMHFELTRSIFSEISRRDLNQLGSLEQALVFDEKKSSDLQNLMSSWNLKR
jgi:hypothetical protein